VFLSTHEQCDKLAKDCQSFAQRHGWSTRAIYGGLTYQEHKEWIDFVRDHPRFIVFATNVAETSITIPNLSLVLDLGIHCIQKNNQIVFEKCPKANMIQRAGRTGRTCPGKVIRYMTQSAFDELPFQVEPEHNWDLMVLRILRHKIDPSTIYSTSCDDIISKFQFYGIMTETGLDEKMAHFVVHSHLLFKNSVFLYKFLKFIHSPTSLFFFIVAISFIDISEARLMRSYYYSSDMKMSRARFLENLIDIFGKRPDELELRLNIFFSCLYAEDPFEFSKAFSLNFRSFRFTKNHIQKTFRYVAEYLKIQMPDLQTMNSRDNFDISPRKGLLSPKLWNIFHLYRDVMNNIQIAFFNMDTIPRLTSSAILQRKNFFVEFHNCIISPNKRIYGIILFHVDDGDVFIDEWIDRDTIIDYPIHIHTNIYTLLPTDIHLHLSIRRLEIRTAHRNYQDICRARIMAQQKFIPVLKDIEEDVAFRPGQWKMKAMIENLFSFLSTIRHSIK
jgi:hypothetical protein